METFANFIPCYNHISEKNESEELFLIMYGLTANFMKLLALRDLSI